MLAGFETKGLSAFIHIWACFYLKNESLWVFIGIFILALFDHFVILRSFILIESGSLLLFYYERLCLFILSVYTECS
jgi:hypothetical protein